VIGSWLDRARRRISYERNRIRSTAVLLLYHRVTRPEVDPYGLCVAPERFEEHLRVVRETGRPLALAELASRVRGGGVPDGAVCLTFDDGYRDNLHTARPLLARHDVPATVFVVAGEGGRERELWWDRLEDLFLHRDPLPDPLVAEVDGEPLRLSTRGEHTEAEPFDDAPPVDDARSWRLFASPRSARQRALRTAWERIRPLDAERREEAIDALFAAAGLRPRLRDDRRTMTAGELAELEEGGLVTVGAHTAEHLHLPSHPAAVQEADIRVGRERLEAWLGHPVDTFAYPFGALTDEAVATVRRLGFAAACSGEWAPVVSRSDPLRLPRVEVGDVDGEALARQLAGLMGR